MIQAPPLNVQRDQALREYNTLRLQAQADAFVTVNCEDELFTALAWARAHSLPVVPIGEGSNIVLTGNLHALVIRQETRGMEVIETTSSTVKIRVAAGENWHGLVQWSLRHGFYGLQNLALIPGTVGAAPIQNIGAYGVELNSVLTHVHAVRLTDHQRIVLGRGECEFRYRDSIFKHQLVDQVLILAIDLQLSLAPVSEISYPALQQFFQSQPSVEATPQAVFDAVVNIRRSKLPDPAIEPNAGSFFKNPMITGSDAKRLHARFPALPQYPQADGGVKLAAAWMIEHCGWKGYRRENLGVHAQHALVLVNYGDDSGARLLELARQIAESVYREFNVELEMEPRLYGHRS